MFRCFGHGADKTIRTDSPMAWKLSGLSDPLHPLPSSVSLLLSKFLVKETGVGSLRAAAHERNASEAQDGLTGRRGEERRLAFEEREEERRKWTQCMHSAHRRDPPPTQPLPNHGLSQFRPSRHHFISTCCCCLWAQRPWQQGLKAGGEGVGLHCCSGLHRQPVSTPSVALIYLFIVGFGSTVFWAPCSRVHTWHKAQTESLARWLQIKRHSIDAGDTRANWTTGRDPEPQRRRSKTLLPPFSF